MTLANSQTKSSRPHARRYVALITEDGHTRELHVDSTYRDTILFEARERAYHGRPGTVARVIDTRKRVWFEWARGTGYEFTSRAGAL